MTPSKNSTPIKFTPPAQPSGPGQRSMVPIIILAGLLLVAIAAIALLLRGDKKVNKFPPYQSVGYARQTTPEEKVRYVLIDIQLGGVEDYYRKYQQEDSNIQQALYLWDQGVRVVNLYQFDRVEMGDDGWQVVYGGTGQTAQCTDIVLTQDINATGNDEARIRYILADAQLGNVIDYYRQYTDETAVMEAVKRWDQGVRVANISSFERILAGQAGWHVVYTGSHSLINGMDVVLTAEQTTQQIPAGNPESPTDPGVSCSDDEARIRYILADIQLGGLDGYYRGFPGDPDAVEAIRRWDSGVRVLNLAAAERKDVSGKGWQVVYAGTDNTVCGGELQLSEGSDSQMASGVERGVCNNRFWPVVDGASWEYTSTFSEASGDTQTTSEYWLIQGIAASGEKTTFTVWIDTDEGRGGPVHYYCDATGIYIEGYNGWDLVLPPEAQIAVSSFWNTASGLPVIVTGMSTQSTSFGNLEVASFQFGDVLEYSTLRSFISGIGMSSETQNSDVSQAIRELTTYRIH